MAAMTTSGLSSSGPDGTPATRPDLRRADGSAVRVLVVDDVFATGGTLAATCELVESCGASVASIELVLEIGALEGRAKLAGYEVHSVVTI